MSSERASNSSWVTQPVGRAGTQTHRAFLRRQGQYCLCYGRHIWSPLSLSTYNLVSLNLVGWTLDSTSQDLLHFLSSLQAPCPGPRNPARASEKPQSPFDCPREAMVGLCLMDLKEQGPLCSRCLTSCCNQSPTTFWKERLPADCMPQHPHGAHLEEPWLWDVAGRTLANRIRQPSLSQALF